MDGFLEIVGLLIIMLLAIFGLYCFLSVIYDHFVYQKNPKICFNDRVEITHGFYKGQIGTVCSSVLGEYVVHLSDDRKMVICRSNHLNKIED